MASLTTHFFMLNTLSRGVSISAFIPESACKSKNPDETYPVIWLLHDIGGNHADWARFTMAEELAEQSGFVCIMPSIDFSFCANVDSGRYEDFLADELYRFCCTMYPISPERNAQYLLGYGLGGYAAIRLALARSDRYAGAGSIDGANVAQYFPSNLGDEQKRQCALSLHGLNQELLCGSQFDLYRLAQVLVSQNLPRPRLWAFSSKDSKTAEQMGKDVSILREIGIDYTLRHTEKMPPHKCMNECLAAFFDELCFDGSE